ncbi:MAG: hypothetical protein ACPG8W_12500 [Candidatus Promineifilaceae bacterium]
MINFRDFSPEVAEHNMFGLPKSYETMKSLMVTVNQWLSAQQVDVISVETLFVATRSAQNYQLTDEIETFGLPPSQMGRQLQVIRVWYNE